jgi:hypothetical protein
MAGLAAGVAHGRIRRPLRTETDIGGDSGSLLFVLGAGAVTGYAAVVAATCQRAVGGIGNGVNGGVFELVTGEALAFRSLRIRKRASGRQYDQGAEKTDFSLDSSHFYCCSTMTSNRSAMPHPLSIVQGVSNANDGRALPLLYLIWIKVIIVVYR